VQNIDRSGAVRQHRLVTSGRLWNPRAGRLLGLPKEGSETKSAQPRGRALRL